MSLTPVDRNYVVVDGEDVIYLRLALIDQLGAPFPNATGAISSTVSGVSFNPPSPVVLDSNGTAIVGVSATESGVADIIADFGNGVTATLPIQRRPSALQADRLNLSLGVGGSDTINLTLLNTQLTGDLYTFHVVGLDDLDPAWYSFSPTQLPLNGGQVNTSRFTVSVPPGECGSAGSYPVQISATRSNGQIVGPLNGAVNISPTAPTLSGVLPATAGRVGSKDVLFSWRSNTTGTATIYVRAAGETDYTSYPMPASTSDSTFFSTTVELIPEGTYEWYGSFETGCGTTMIGNATSPRTFDRVVSISFEERGYTYMIRDGYDLTTTSTGLPLQVRLRNDAATPIRVQVNTETVTLTLSSASQARAARTLI